MNASTRYIRQTILPELGTLGQEKLTTSKVLVIGAGGLGIPVLQYLVAGGVGIIGIIDSDVVDLSNLHRQVLYSEQDLGKYKVVTAKEKLTSRNSAVNINIFNERLEVSNIKSIFKDYDLIIDGCDNFGTRYLVNDACVVLGKPFISASLFKFEGQLSLFNANINGITSPSLRCLYPESPSSNNRPNCADIGTLGPICGILGSWSALEAIKYLVGFGSSLHKKLLVVDLLNLNINFLNFTRNDEVILSTNIRDQVYYDNLNTCDVGNMIKEINYNEYQEMEANGKNVMLLDVRENSERETFHIGGVHIPLGELLAKANTLPKDKEIVCYCHGGVRSMQAAKILTEHFEHEKVYNLIGGVSVLM